MTVLAAVLAIALVVIGVIGIVVPVLPGSLAIGAGLLLWVLMVPSPGNWVVFGVGALLVAGGAASSALITGQRLKAREIPNRSVVVGVVVGVIGLFVIPVVGLPLGFVVGLFLMEWWRVQNVRQAWSSSWTAITSLGLGMGVELACGLLAATALLIGILTTFLA